MESAITCINLRNSQPQFSLTITAASLIRNTSAIISTNLLKQDMTFSLNIFCFRILLLRRHSLVIILSTSSGDNCSSSSGRGSGSTSSCGGNIKIFTWARVGKHNLRTRADKWKVSVKFGKRKLGARAGKYKSGTRVSKYKLGPRTVEDKSGVRARGQGNG